MLYRQHAKFLPIVLNLNELGVYADVLSDELLMRALKRCEIDGVTCIDGG